MLEAQPSQESPHCWGLGCRELTPSPRNVPLNKLFQKIKQPETTPLILATCHPRMQVTGLLPPQGLQSRGARVSCGSVPLTSHQGCLQHKAVGREPSPAPQQPSSTQPCPMAVPQHPALPDGSPTPGQSDSLPPSWFLLRLCPCWRCHPVAKSCPGGVTAVSTAGQSRASARDTHPFPCTAKPSLHRELLPSHTPPQAKQLLGRSPGTSWM